MKHFLITTSILGVLAAGCGLDRVSGPEPYRASWDQVQMLAGPSPADSVQRVLAILPDGALSLERFASESESPTEHDGWGNGASTQGLLAGGKLETLARLVEALPPHSYAPDFPCAPDSFVVSVTRGGEVLTWKSCAGDPDMPAGLDALREFYREITGLMREPRGRSVELRVLVDGTSSAIHDERRVILSDRDALVRLLREHHPEGPLAIPRVDFAREVVVAEFTGERPSGGHIVIVDGVEETESGWMRFRFVRTAPGEGCVVTQALTQPFVIFAVERRSDDVIFETTASITQCR